MRKVLLGCLSVAILLVVLALPSGFPSATLEAQANDLPEIVSVALAEEPTNPYYRIETVTLSNGDQLERIAINGPPQPPAGYELERAPVTPPVGRTADAASLPVPAYNWVFGCTAVSAAMIGGYYDRNGLPNIYTGPANGGVMPMDNSGWPKWKDGTGTTYPSLPLAASRNGIDGRTTRGSIENYWVAVDSTKPDPYITNGWTQHTWGDAFGDYMKTSQSKYNNPDGQTMIYNWTGQGKPLTCAQMEAQNIAQNDGSAYGRKLFYEARGYTVGDCYNQRTDNDAAGGFTFAQFKAQIDAGHPVMVHIKGHTMAGVGYKEPNIIYIHDTWDYETHQMTWGGTYAGQRMYAVSVVIPVRPATTGPTISSLNPSSATAGGAAFTLTVNGTNFVNGSTVRWNGANRTTTYVSATQLKAAITAADIAKAGTAAVTVANPGTGGTSTAATFTVRAATTSSRVYMPTAMYVKTVAPTGPTPGFWRHSVDSRMYFYVTPDRGFVNRLAIQVNIDGCGRFIITHIVPEKITNMKFAFGGPFYASGTFSTNTKAAGTLGLDDYDLRQYGCGYVSGGPWPWDAVWLNANQPTGIEVGGVNQVMSTEATGQPPAGQTFVIP